MGYLLKEQLGSCLPLPDPEGGQAQDSNENSVCEQETPPTYVGWKNRASSGVSWLWQWNLCLHSQKWDQNAQSCSYWVQMSPYSLVSTPQQKSFLHFSLNSQEVSHFCAKLLFCCPNVHYAEVI
jgi:hypothetical protein